MNKHIFYKLILERLTALTQYSQLTDYNRLSESEIDQLLNLLEQAEDDPILSVLMELLDEQIMTRKPSLTQTEKDHYDQQGEKFRQKLQHLSLMN